MDLKNYHVDGEYVHEGITLSEERYPSHHVERLKSFKFYEDDVFIATYPRSGTTWMQELAYLINTEGDFDGAAKATVMERGPFIDVYTDGYKGAELAEKLPRPRQMKTHLQYKIFKDTIPIHKPKVIVVMRNLKDNLVSYYHFYRAFNLYHFPGNFSDFLQLFYEKRIVFGDWFDFILGWWEQRDNPNILFIKYEDMKKDMHAVIGQLCTFLGKSLEPKLIDAIIEHTSFCQMKDNDKTNYTSQTIMDQGKSRFVRKGIVGDWREHFTPEVAEQFDKMIAARLAGTGLSFEC